MGDLLEHCTSNLFPTLPHIAIISGATGCGKTIFILNLLEKDYRHVLIISLFCALRLNTIDLTTSDLGYGVTQKSISLIRVIDFMIACEYFTKYSKGQQPCISLTTVRQNQL